MDFFINKNWRFISGLSIGVLSSGLLFYFNKKSKSEVIIPKKWVRVGTLYKLILYPVKSCRGIEVDKAEAAQIGLTVSENFRDRIFMIVDHKYACQSQYTLPILALIQVEINGNEVTLNAPNVQPITFSMPKNCLKNKRSCRLCYDYIREVLDCGDEVGQWLDLFLGNSTKNGYRLVYHALHKTQRKPNFEDLRFPTFVPSDKSSFHGETSYMLMSLESVAALNKSLKNLVTYKNFRPSLIIHEIPEPFAEELWSFIRIGGEDGPIFKYSSPCRRCKVTTINQDTGKQDSGGEPLKTLTSLHHTVGDEVLDKLIKGEGVMGVRLGLFKEGVKMMEIGDPVYAAIL